MKLSKFFRRHTRTLLMIFMSLLLIVFLVGDQLQSWAQRASQAKLKLGQAFGRNIYTTDWQVADGKMSLLAALNLLDRGVMRDPLDFILLTEEARRAGVRLGHDQVKAMITRIYEGGVEQAQQMLQQVQHRYGLSYAAMYDTIAEWLAVAVLAEVQAEALGESLPRAELAYRNEAQPAEAQISVIDSRGLLSAVPQPTEADLQAFFEQTKERGEEHTDDALQFGHRLPDRVRVEYLTVDPQRAAPRVRVREKEIQAYFKEHESRYTKLVMPPADPAGTQPAAPQQPVRVPMTLDEAREQVLADVRLEKAVREAQALVNDIRHEAYQPWQTALLDDSGFRTPPQPEAIGSFAALRDKYSERFEVTYVRTELLDADALAQHFDPRPEVLRQRGSREPLLRQGQTAIPLSALAFRVKGIYTPAQHDPLPVLNVLEPSHVMLSYKPDQRAGRMMPYQAYVFRVCEVVPQGPPASLEEVRARLTEDWRLLKAHELGGQYARSIADRAAQGGLSQAVAEAPDLHELLTQADDAATAGAAGEPRRLAAHVRALGPQPLSLTRHTTGISQVGSTPKVAREVFRLADASATQPATPHRVVVFEVARLFKWVIIELGGVQPIYEGDFAVQRPRLLQGSGQEAQRLWANWIASENVRQRTGYVTSGLMGATAEPLEP